MTRKLDFRRHLRGVAAVVLASAGATGDPNPADLFGRSVPAEQVSAPADKPIVFRIKNLDGKAMEFESKSLRVEKVVAAKSEGVINVRALKPGRYEFYDDFNEKARGALTVQ